MIPEHACAGPEAAERELGELMPVDNGHLLPASGLNASTHSLNAHAPECPISADSAGMFWQEASLSWRMRLHV